MAAFVFPLINVGRAVSEPSVTLTSITHDSQLMVFALVLLLGAVIALLAMMYVPTLFVVAIFSLIAAILSIQQIDVMNSNSSYSLSGVFLISAAISFLLAIWDIRHRQYLRRPQFAAVEEF